MVDADHERVREIPLGCFRWLAPREGWNDQQLAVMLAGGEPIENIRKQALTQQWWVAESDGLVLGFASILGNEIAKLYVDPAHHRESIDRTLFQTAEDAIRAAGFATVGLGAGATSRPFYEAMGMVAVGERITPRAGVRRAQGHHNEKAPLRKLRLV